MWGVLLHELTHVVEYLNDPKYMSVETVDDCTALAQTMEKQLAPFIWNLKIIGTGGNLLDKSALTVKSQARKRSKSKKG